MSEIYLNKYNIEFLIKNELKLIMIDKLFLSNSYLFPFLKKIDLNIHLKNLNNFNDKRFLASFFLLKFLTKKSPYILKLNVFQTFKKKRYDSIMKVTIKNHLVWDFLMYLNINILFKLSNLDLKINMHRTKNNVIFLNYIILDLNILKIVEMHSIFFKWKDILNINLMFNTNCKNNIFILNNLLKFLNFKI